MTTGPLAIALTAHNRPGRLERMLSTIAAADGASAWSVHLSIEPTERSAEIEAVAARFGGRLNLRSRVNAERLGVRRNPFETVQWALAGGHRSVLLLEDDLLLDRQGLRCAALLDAGPLHEPGVMAANLLTTTCMSESVFMPNGPGPETDALAEVVVRTRFFSSYGLLFSAAQWRSHFVPNWFSDSPAMENFDGDLARGWDVAMTRTLLLDRSLRVLQSLLPRVTHDGADGTHVDERFQQSSFAHVRVDLAPTVELLRLQVLDPVTDLGRVPGAAARMYLNLARHLWTLQASSLAFKHRVPSLHGAKPKTLRLGSHEYTLFRRRRGA